MAEEKQMRFFVEETSFQLSSGISAAELEQHLDAFVQCIAKRHENGEDVFRHSKLLEETELQPGITLLDVLYQRLEHLPIDKDIQLGLQQALNRCLLWDEIIEPIPAPNVEIDGVTSRAATVAAVHALISRGRGAVCLVFGAPPSAKALTMFG